MNGADSGSIPAPESAGGIGPQENGARFARPWPRLKTDEAVIPAVRESFGNPPWASASARVLIVRLSCFPDVNRSTSHLFLFAECRRALPGIFLDFAFFPEPADRQKLSRQGLPWFFGLASGRSVSEFDLALVSNSFVLELLNLPSLFLTAGLPLYSSERLRAGLVRPLVVLGGANAAAAGAVVSDSGDALVDGIFFGEGEKAVGDLVRVLTDGSRPARERLASAAEVAGFWPTGSVRPAPKRVLDSPGAGLLPTAYPVLNSEEASTARLQITYGCPAFCSFCLQGWDRKPYREVPREEVLEAALALKRQTGAETLEVQSFNFNMHRDVFSLLLELHRLFRNVRFTSQRADFLARVPLLLRAEAAAGKHDFTLGVEGISARLRAYYRKGLSEQDLEAVLRSFRREHVRELKLFYILSGLEEEEDFREFAQFVGGLRSGPAVSGPGARVIFSFGFLVRFPFTPLQFEKLALDEDWWRLAGDTVRKAVESRGFEFRFAQRFDEYATEQVLALGGSACLEWLAGASARGHGHDRNLSPGAWQSLKAFAASRGILSPEFLGEKGARYLPPLGAAVSGGVSPARLYQEFLLAKRHEDAGPCLGTKCLHCGACGDREQRDRITAHALAVPGDPDFTAGLVRLLKWKAALEPVYARVNLPATLAGAQPEYLAGWLLRVLFNAAPETAKVIFQARETLFGSGPLAGMLPAFSGVTRFAVFGSDREAAADVLRRAGFEPVEDDPMPARVRVEITVPPALADEALRTFQRWLADERVAPTLMKREASRRFAFSEKGLKRQVVCEAATDTGASGTRFSLVLGRKARLGGWFALMRLPRGCVPGPVVVTALEPAAAALPPRSGPSLYSCGSLR